MKKLLLINPVGRKSGFLLSRYSTFPPLSLAYLAALTPADWQVTIIDENFDAFAFQEADLVGITAFTSNINRAYELCRVFREHNVPVILGGIHVSMMPDEALQHADAILVGEAEEIWAQVLADTAAGTLQRQYTGPHVDLEKISVHPRHDLMDSRYFWHSVQTSRGCPFDCSFCSVTKYLGKSFRQRSVDDVLAELEKIPGRYVTFVDDNLIGCSRNSFQRAKELFQGMIDRGLNKKWWMQTSVNSIEDEEVVRLAAAAGCTHVFIGFESVDQNILRSVDKGVNLKPGAENYKKVIQVYHKYGIAVLGAFIIGNDHESVDYYRQMARYLLHSGIDIIQITVLTPLPGTRLLDELQEQQRLSFCQFPEDWEKYRFSYMVHEPVGLNAELVYQGNNYIKQKIYGFPYFYLRLLRSLLSLRNWESFRAVYKANFAYRKGWENSHYRQQFKPDF